MPRPLYLQTNMLVMFGVTLTAILGVSSIMPVLPDLIEVYRIEPRNVGLVITAFTLPGVFLAPLTGILADRIGRKKILVPALVVFGVSGAACAFAPSYEALLALRAVQGIGAGPLGVLYLTIIGDLYEGRERVMALGYNASALSVGTAAFPAVGGLMARGGWHYPFLLPAVALPLALVVALYLDNPEPRNKTSFGRYLKGAWDIMRTRKAVGIFTLTLLAFIILYGCFVTYLPLLMRMKFGAPAHSIGLIVSIASAITAVAASQAGRLNQRVPAWMLLGGAAVCYGTAMALIPEMPAFWALLAPITLYGLAQGLNFPPLMGLLAGLAPLEGRAAIMAVNGTVLRLSQTTAPMVMGLVFAGFGLHGVFLGGTLVAASMLTVVLTTIRPEN